MRISTIAAFQKSVSSLQERKRKIDEAQEHLDGQKRVLRASDDPVAAARAERARAQIASSDARQRSLDASRNAMTQTESALGDAGELVSEAKAALVSVGNGIFTDADRNTVAEKLQNLRDQLLSLANSEDGSGHYVFGGQDASAPPFAQEASGMVSFKGAPGEQFTAGAEGLPLTVNGARAWGQALDGNGFFKVDHVVDKSGVESKTAYVDGGRVVDLKKFSDETSPPPTYEVQFTDTGSGAMAYTVLKNGAAIDASYPKPWAGGGAAREVGFDGMSFSIGGTLADGDKVQVQMSQPANQNLFTTLDQAIKDLKTPGRTSAQITQTLQDAQAGLSRSADALSALRSRVGEALVHVDDAESRNADAKHQAQIVRSGAEDLDPVAALSDMQLQSTNYEIALKTYASVQKLSMFNYIG